MTRTESGQGTFISTDLADFTYMDLNVPCQAVCPAFTNIPGYIKAIWEKDPDRSYEINRGENLFPGVLGRICSRPCESKCRHSENELGEAVGICHLKRAAGDLKKADGLPLEPLLPSQGQSVGIVGAGPAGLAAAHDLATLGFGVTLYEGAPKAGGMLRYGIPDFRLPPGVLDSEIDPILTLGVELRCGVRVGRDLPVEKLLQRHGAVLLAAGCYRARTLGVPGEGLSGVHSGLAYMTAFNSGDPLVTGKRVLILGGGFTAFDCARSALRLGAGQVSICLRRTENDLRVTQEEIHQAKLEGIKLLGLMTSKRIMGEDQAGGVEFIRTRLGGRPGRGRGEVISIAGSEFVMPADTIIVATGQGPETLGTQAETGGRIRLLAKEGSWASTQKGLFACGDFATGPSTVIQALAGGRAAAEEIARHLTGRKFRRPVVRMEDTGPPGRRRTWDFIPRQPMRTVLPAPDRLQSPGLEVELGLGEEAAEQESRRCYLCYLHYEIDQERCIFCRLCLDAAPRDCIKMVSGVSTDESGAITGYRQTSRWNEVNAVIIDNSRCIRCGECMRVCPVNCISITRVERCEELVAGKVPP